MIMFRVAILTFLISSTFEQKLYINDFNPLQYLLISILVEWTEIGVLRCGIIYLVARAWQVFFVRTSYLHWHHLCFHCTVAHS